MIKVAVCGAMGKMGKEVCLAVEECPETELVAKIDIASDGMYHSIADAHRVEDIDILVDFTQPKSIFENAKYCLNNNIKIVIGTTGLKDKEIITEIEAQNIDKEKLLEYTNSQLWTELKQAKEIHKEHPFYINIKASRIYNQINKEDDEDILVQGVIDLFFIDKDDNLILVDYKTDYVQNENELIEKYKGQLDLYKEALEQSLDKKVDRMCIYSVYLNKLIEIGI